MGFGYLHTYIHVGVVGVEKTRRGIKFVPGLRCMSPEAETSGVRPQEVVARGRTVTKTSM